MIDVGNNCYISEEWIPKGVNTQLKDVNGVALKTADRVRLNGCTSEYAIVGRDMTGKFVLYFGGRYGSVSWGLSEEMIARYKIRSLNSR